MIDPTAIWTYRAQPGRVIDGDTVELLIDLGMDARIEIHVRILNVDCPEKNSSDPAVREAARAASAFTEGWLAEAATVDGKWPLWIRTHKDRRSFTRYIAEVWDSQGRNLRDDLIASGHGTAA